MSKRLQKVQKILCTATSDTSVGDAIAIKDKYREFAAKFDETVVVTFRLNIDPRKTDQMVRGFVSMPSPVFVNSKVLVFTKDVIDIKNDNIVLVSDINDIAISSGRISMGNNVYKLNNFKYAVAAQGMMSQLPRIAKSLGTKGLMPNAKYGTIATNDIKTLISSIVAGCHVKFSASNDGVVHIPVGKLSAKSEDLLANIKVAIEAVLSLKPITIKGDYIQSVYMSSTMGFKAKLNYRSIQ